MSSFRRQRTSWGDQPHEQEYWLSYSDLLAGMLMIFALMLFAALHHYGGIIQQAGQIASTRSQIIETLREMMDQEVTVDPITGAARFPDGVLFDQNSAVLRPEGIRQLDRFAEKYFGVLLDDPAIRTELRAIVIEGHTNDDIGTMDPQSGYMYNLNLSQQRAFAVMRHFVERIPKHRDLLKQYVTASGRSFSQPVCENSGPMGSYPCPDGDRVDSERSRRIEIVFRLNDEEVLEQVRGLLLVR